MKIFLVVGAVEIDQIHGQDQLRKEIAVLVCGISSEALLEFLRCHPVMVS